MVSVLLLAGLQSACSLMHSPTAPEPGGAEAVAAQYSMTSFRYEIPLPHSTKTAVITQTRIEPKSAPGRATVREIPEGFELQSFVERLFQGRQRGAETVPAADTEVASIRQPEPPRPAQPFRDQTQREFCARINNRLASIQYEDCMAVALGQTGHFSNEGLPIMRTQFAAVRGVEPTGRVLMVGGVHGDELSSVSIVFEWMQFLREHHDGEFVWDVIPVMNPDGLFRKKPMRTNANGVDLNRNMPTSDWQKSAIAYWRNRAGGSPRKFPGHSAASEPETRWLIDEIDQFRPDMIITVHAPHNLIDYDAPSRKNAPRRFGQLKGGLLGTYPGSLGNYAGVKRGIPVVTIELPSANTAISIAQAQEMWADMLEWLEKTIPLENKRFMQNRNYAQLR